MTGKSSLVFAMEKMAEENRGTFGDQEDEEMLPEDDSGDVFIKF